MAFSDIFRIGAMKKEISALKSEVSFNESQISKMDKELSDYKILDSLGRLIKCPCALGNTVYIIMRRDLHPKYDNELIGMRKSDTVRENNIKIVAVTISHYIIQPSGLYLGFEEQHKDGVVFHIKADSKNLFINMHSAIHEMYSDSDKSEYYVDPFVVLKKEYTLHIANASIHN